jgi:hypothetical protein
MDRYAFLLTAMSMAEAKEILGFLPDSSPTPRDIKEAYREKAQKLHPDRGGDEDAMVDLNVAKDILEGKARPTYQRPQPRYEAPEPPRRTEVTFDQAESRAGIPSGVDWLFVTPTQRGTSWASDESSQSNETFVAYGRTDRQHVFVAAYYHSRQDYYIGGTHDESIWVVKSIELPIKEGKGEAVQPRWLYGNVVKALKGVGFKGRFNSKVIDAQGWRLNARLPSGPTTSIKHWLVNSGQVESTDPSVVSRKQVVELQLNTSHKEKPDYHEKPRTRGNFWDGEYRGEYIKLTLVLNGRPFATSKDDLHKFMAKIGLGRVFGEYYYDRSKKQLTRMRAKGKKIIGWMLENFNDLSADAREILTAAEAQMKG